VTGAKRYRPITSDDDYLIVQNIWALKLMIMAIERTENGNMADGAALRQQSLDLLKAEVKKHQLDPRNTMRRKAEYDADLVNYLPTTFGYVRARLAHEVPGGLNIGKSELTRLLEQAEMRLMDKGHWVGTFEELRANVCAGHIILPARVKSVIHARLGNCPVDIRAISFQYIKNGPGMEWACGNILYDEGEVFIESTGQRRRKYRLNGAAGTEVDSFSDTLEGQQRLLTVVAKLRWEKKAPTDKMTLGNFEGIRLMVRALLAEKEGQIDPAMNFEKQALNEMEKELRNHLSGVKHVMNFEDDQDVSVTRMGTLI